MIFQLKIFKYEFLDKLTVVYVDESGFALDAPRNRGYSLKGSKCYGCKDWHAKGRVNAIGAIVDFEFINVCLFDTNINSDIFYAWTKEQLLPSTPANSVIVLDNATFHKRNDILEIIDKQKHIVEFLPPYSPDLNPIEKKWAQAKSIRRKYDYKPDDLFSCPEL